MGQSSYSGGGAVLTYPEELDIPSLRHEGIGNPRSPLYFTRS